MSYFESIRGFTKLIKAFKLMFVLSHGEMDIECGCSINRSLLIEYLLKESLISWRIIDYVKADEFKSLNIPITSDPLKSVQTSQNRYSQCFEEKRIKKSLMSNRNLILSVIKCLL